MGSEEESLKQELGCIERDISELTRVCGEQKKKIEKEKWTFDFRLKWAMEQSERRQSSATEAEEEAEDQAERGSSEHDLDQDPEARRPSRTTS